MGAVVQTKTRKSPPPEPEQEPSQPQPRRSLSDWLSAPVPADLMSAFRVYFAFHVAVQSLKLSWSKPDTLLTSTLDPWILLLQLCMFGAAALTLHPKHCDIGLYILLGFKLVLIAVFFPMTPNHYYLEAYVMTLLLLCPNRSPIPSPGKTIDGTGCRLIQLVFVSTYVYAGIQKLLYGCWDDGEFLLQSLFRTNEVTILHTTQWTLQGVANVLGLTWNEFPSAEAFSLGPSPVAIPGWVIGLLMVTSWVVMLTELIFPPLLLFPRTRKVGLVLMSVMAIAIGLLAWEMEFLFAAVGCLMLFMPGNPWRNFGCLLAAHMAWSFLVWFADWRILIF